MRIQYQILGFLLFLYSNNIKIENAVGKSKIPILLHADRDPRTAMHDACARCWLAGMHVCARDGWKMRGASQPIVTVPFRKFHTPSTRALHPAHAPCGRARTPTTRAVLEFLSYLRGSPGEKYRIQAPIAGTQRKSISIFFLFFLTVTLWKMCERPTQAVYCIGCRELE